MNDNGQIEIFPETTAERAALRGWDALHPVRKVHEGFLVAMDMRSAAAVITHSAVPPEFLK